MPTRHLNNVTLDRAVLIYNILKGNRVNVGKIISSHLKMKIQEDKSRLLWFPILITELCRRACVACATEDLITLVQRQITERVVQVNIKVGAEIDSGFKTSYKRIRSVASSSSAGKSEKVAVPSGEGATLSEVMDIIEFIKVYMRCQHCYIRSRLDLMERKIDSLVKKAKLQVEEEHFKYQWQFDVRGELPAADGSSLNPTEFEEDNEDQGNEDQGNEDQGNKDQGMEETEDENE
ncbi:hypothetical protein KSP40_PGU018383 [Platanthera guangdongensis]|uniref:Putative plant transposon protein domain-containing protein n=1 Tax=Platanthera guangdongensis TaxID=2320717 RepID=A0ABR2M9C4_9ASPA